MTGTAMGAGRAAVFLDRDGTLIEDPGYLRDPARVRLFDGAGEAVARLNTAGFLVIVVSNQSGIARGLVTEAEYRAVQRRVAEFLAAAGARLDGEYFCPHLPEISGACECRKPGLQLFLQAAERFGIDLAASWWVGDRLRDVLPAETLGGRGILVRTGTDAGESVDPDVGRFPAERFPVASTLAAAVDRILRGGPACPAPS